MRKGRAEQRVTDKLSIGKYGVWIEFCLSEDDFFGKKKKSNPILYLPGLLMSSKRNQI